MEALVKIGGDSVEPLIRLLKNTSKYSCLYAIKILGEIADPRAVEPIIEAFFSESFGNNFQILEEYE